jgi:hypothetical protein
MKILMSAPSPTPLLLYARVVRSRSSPPQLCGSPRAVSHMGIPERDTAMLRFLRHFRVDSRLL